MLTVLFSDHTTIQMKITNYHTREEHANHYTINAMLIRDRPFNLQREGGLWVFFSFRIFFGPHKSQNIYFFCRAKRDFFFQNLTLGYMTKSLNQIIFFFSTKIRIFFQQHWESEYFFKKKKPQRPPWKLNGPSLSERRLYHKNTTI